MTTLVEFLRARLDEDEETARAAEHADGPSTLEWRVAGSRHQSAGAETPAFRRGRKRLPPSLDRS